MEKLVELKYKQVQKSMKNNKRISFYKSLSSPNLNSCFNNLHLIANVYTVTVFPLFQNYIGLFWLYIWPNCSLDLGDFQESNDAPNY